MLLALLIMATITIGLLFSGWLAPVPIKAQTSGPDPSSGDENTNCPNYTYSTNASCPSITDYGAINATSFCVAKGKTVPMPTLVENPAASDGSVIITTTETCSNIVTYTSNDVSYTFSDLQYDPASPTTNSSAGTYTSDCYITVTSSDTNDCPSPGDIDFGDVTWNVIDPTPTTVTFSQDFTALVSALENGLSALPGTWSWTNSKPFIISGSKETSQTCCSDGSVGTKTVKSGSVSAGGSGTGTTPAIPIPWTWGLLSFSCTIQVTITGNFTINNTTTTCPNTAGFHCYAPSVTGTVTGSLNIIAGQNVATGSASITGGGGVTKSWCYYNLTDIEDIADEDPLKLCHTDIGYSGSVSFIGGTSFTVSGTWLKSTCP